MIFVTVGTHEQPFNRLVEAVDMLAQQGVLTEEVIIQTGYSTYTPQHCKWQNLFPYAQMEEMVRQARIVVTHGGPASFMMPLQMGKVPVVVPRQHRFGEHVNDHQMEFCKALSQRQGNLLLVEDIADLSRVLTEYDVLAARCAGCTDSNNAAFNARFGQLMEELLGHS